jgi:hypothetical protein
LHFEPPLDADKPDEIDRVPRLEDISLSAASMRLLNHQ